MRSCIVGANPSSPWRNSVTIPRLVTGAGSGPLDAQQRQHTGHADADAVGRRLLRRRRGADQQRRGDAAAPAARPGDPARLQRQLAQTHRVALRRAVPQKGTGPLAFSFLFFPFLFFFFNFPPLVPRLVRFHWMDFPWLSLLLFFFCDAFELIFHGFLLSLNLRLG